MKYSTAVRHLLATVFLLTVLNGVAEGSDDWDDEDSKDTASIPDPVPVGGARSGSQIAQGQGVASHGSNYAGFNQRCALESEAGIRCNPLIGLTCDMRICKCKNDTVQSDLFSVYTPDVGKCVPVARAVDGWACEYDLQCTSSRKGNYTWCNAGRNMPGRCECLEKDDRGQAVTLIDDVCYVKKEIGSQCTNDLECQATIKGNAVCLGVKSAFGTCDCPGGFYYDPDLNGCFQIGSNEESNCKVNGQCTHESALGELSRCDPKTGKCQCWDTRSSGQSRTAFYKLTKKCFYQRKENEKCDVREECLLGWDRNADCLPHPAYNNEKVCQCPAGETCAAGTSITATFSLLALTVLAFLLKSM